MKTLLSVLFCALLITSYAQKNHRIPLEKAKTLFKKERNLSREELDKFDYQQIVTLLEEAIKLYPKSAEARYYLGYTYSRMNARDGRGMIAMNLDLLYKTSAQFEELNKISPRYYYPLIALDPYSKIGAEWGSMAMSYWHNHKKDSAIWAFREGKKRGGFGEYILGINRAALDACEKNAILISSGDNFSIPLWYLQIVEQYRTDVTVIDVSLLNTTWYPAFLAQTNAIRFDQPQSMIDTMEYTVWTDSIITAGEFAWTVKPSYYNQYLLRGDRVLLSILQENKFQRPVYFTVGFIEDSQLSLKDHLTKLVFVDRVSPQKENALTKEAYLSAITKALKLSEKINRNSPDQLSLFDFFRYDLLQRIANYVENNDKKSGQELMTLLDKLANENKFAYQQPSGKKYLETIRKAL